MVKRTNKPENAVELITMFLGLRNKYPELRVSLYYLQHKDDLGDTLYPFESKKGKNIISHNFTKFSEKSLKRHLYEVIDFSTNYPCNDCRQRGYCVFPREIRGLEKSDKEYIKKGVRICNTKAQEEVITHLDGPMSCIAVPGAGKTFSLVQRMHHLILEGIFPENILFLIFTRKAAEEIKFRVSKELKLVEEKMPNIYTLNGLGFEILRQNPGILGKSARLAGKLDRYMMIQNILKDKNAPTIKGSSYQDIYEKYGLIQSIDKWFLRIDEIGMEKFADENAMKDTDAILSLYQRFQKQWEENGYITFDMQISLCNKMFEKYPALAEIYGKAFQYVMVDEFQDISKENMEFISHIVKRHGNLLVVGDDDQAIFGFRGGENKYILEFHDYFPEAKTVIMQDNYRSNSPILKLSEKLIKENTIRFQKSIVAHREDSHKPIFLRNFQVNKVTQLIDEIIKDGYRPGDIAIIGRYNKGLVQVAEIIKHKYDCHAPKDYLIEDRIFFQMYDLLNLYFTKMQDDISMYHFLIWEGIVAEEYPIVKSNRNHSLYENIIGAESLNTDTLMDKIEQCFSAISCAECMRTLIRSLLMYLYGIENHTVGDLLIDICEERNIMTPYELYAVMKHMILFSDDNRIGYPIDGRSINTLTAHDAKGKEFPVVIIYGVEDFGSTEEERRLLYVAMTRAKNKLIITECMRPRVDLLKGCMDLMHVI